MLLEAFQSFARQFQSLQLPAMATRPPVHLPQLVFTSTILSPAQRIVVQPLRESDIDHERGWHSFQHRGLSLGQILTAFPRSLLAQPLMPLMPLMRRVALLIGALCRRRR
jgi:hypothetical protein